VGVLRYRCRLAARRGYGRPVAERVRFRQLRSMAPSWPAAT